MKKLFIVILCVVSIVLVGCSVNNKELKLKESKAFTTLNNVTYPNAEDDGNIQKNDTSYLDNFNTLTTKLLFTEEKDYIYSPTSLYMALSMLVQGASGDTRNEIMQLLMENENIDKLNSFNKTIYNNNYYKNKKGTTKLSNSLWIEYGFPVKDDFISSLTSNYYANIYGTKFDDEGKENIAKWINYHTNDFLDYKAKDIPTTDETVMMLINTVYFDHKWKVEFKEKNTYTDVFYGNSQENIEYMHHTITSQYIETEDCEIFYDYFENKNKIKYIFPKSNYSVKQCLENNYLNSSLMNYEIKNVEIRLSVPKFESKSSYTLNETLETLGLRSMFTMQSDFSNISDVPTYVSLVKQDAGISFSETGVKAAAVTSVANDSVVNMEEYITIKLNRPFIYVIMDENNIPLFVGAYYNQE